MHCPLALEYAVDLFLSCILSIVDINMFYVIPKLKIQNSCFNSGFSLFRFVCLIRCHFCHTRYVAFTSLAKSLHFPCLKSFKVIEIKHSFSLLLQDS